MSRLAAKDLTDTPDAALRQKIAAKAQAAKTAVPDVRPLSEKEMRGLTGRGPWRNSQLDGTMPWHRSLRDVNMCTGNVFKNTTDMQISPGRGTGLVLARTYNSDDDRVGPFGIGWTHAYDIRMEEAGVDATTQAEKANRVDFFGGKHTYTRDADGLYTPPPYLYDELSSKYDQELANGPSAPTEDSQKGMDGTVKHFIDSGAMSDGTPIHTTRICDTITDRHGNVTTLTYGATATMADGSTQKLLTQVTDPVGRSIVFSWNNIGTTRAPAYRIVQVEGPFDASGNPVSGVTYKVVYGYYTDASAPASFQNLHTVTLDSEGLSRTTTYTYTSVTADYTDPATSTTTSDTENGLLASISDPLGHTVSYGYASSYTDLYGDVLPMPTQTIWATSVSEPAGVTTTGSTRTLNWTISPVYAYTGLISYGSSDAGALFEVATDTSLRCVQMNTLTPSSTGTYILSGNATYETTYDSACNVTKVKRYVSDHTSDFGSSTDTFTYGPHGDQWTATTAALSSNPTTTTTTYYDASKYFQKATVTDPMGHVSAIDYYDDNDASQGNWGEIKWVRDAGYAVSGSPSYGKEFDYTYNAYGQKATETNLAGIVTTYTYGDSYGNLTQVIQDPSNPTASYAGLARTTSMSYDITGKVVSSTDPNGRSTSFLYNTLGQPTSASFPAVMSGMTTVTPSETVSYSYGANGRQTAVTDNRGTTSMSYEDGCDRLSSVTDPVTGTITYTYLASGERASMMLPDGKTWTYKYADTATSQSLFKDDPDKVGHLLTGITDDAGHLVNFASDMFGHLFHTEYDQQYTAGGSLSKYVQTTYGYDQMLFLAMHPTSHYWIEDMATKACDTSTTTPTLLSRNQYTYDNDGQRTSNIVSTTVTSGTSSVSRGAIQF